MDYATHAYQESDRIAGKVWRVTATVLRWLGWLMFSLILFSALAVLWMGDFSNVRFGAPSAMGIAVLDSMNGAKLVLPTALSLMLICLLALNLRTLRRRRAWLVMEHLNTAVQLNLPLPAYLAGAASGEDRFVRRRLLLLCSQLEFGQPVGRAVHATNGELELRVTSLLDAAEATGQLRPTLQRLVDRSELDESRSGDTSALVYLFLLFSTMYSVVMLVMIFVMPKFAMIFHDFKISLPPVTESLLQLPLAWMAIFVLPLNLLVLMMIVRYSRQIFTSVSARAWYHPPLDALLWRLPLARQLVRTHEYADFCWVVSGALRSGNTLVTAVDNAIRPDCNSVFQVALRDLLTRITAGVPAAVAAAQARLPTLIVSLMKTPGPDLAQAMEFAAAHYAARHGRLATTLRAALPVIATLLMGALVMFVAVSLFTPLATLISEVAPKAVRL